MLVAVQLLLLAVSVGPYRQTVEASATATLSKLSNEAAAAQEKGDYRLAADKYRAILKLRPQLIEARFNLGLMLHLAGDYSDAAASLKEVLQRDPNSFPSNFMLGVELLRTQRPHEAIVFLTRAHKLQPENGRVALSLAQAELLVDDYHSAYLRFSELTDKKPMDSDAWYGLGLSSLAQMRSSLLQLSLYAKESVYTKLLLARSYAERGYRKQAEEIYSALLPRTEPACIASSLAVLRQREGDIALSQTLLRQDRGHICSATVQQDAMDPNTRGFPTEASDIPQPEWAYQHCGAASPEVPPHDKTPSLHSIACAEQARNYRQALLLSQSRLAALPHEPASLYWQVRASRNLAFAALARVQDISPGSVQLHLLLGHILLDEEQWQSSEQEYQQAIRQDPASVQAHLGLAMVEYRARRFDDAIPELQRTIALAPLDGKANYLLGSILAAQAKYASAQTYLETAQQNASADDRIPARALLAKVYTELGRSHDAVRQLEACLAADTDGSYHYRISLLYRKLGRKQEAAEALRASAQIRSNNRAQGDEPKPQ